MADQQHSTETVALILAAGKGTRMKSDLPKVLFPICGRPMIEYVLDAVEAAGMKRQIVVIGFRGELVREALRHRGSIDYVEQTQQLGTGHAVQVCAPLLQGHLGALLVLTGDSPLTQTSSLQALLDLYLRERPACVMGTLHKPDPQGLGRIVRDAHGQFLAIVEEKDATPEQRLLTEVNMSTYVFHTPDLLPILGQLRSDNRQGEFYITDCPGLLRRYGKDVRALPVLQPCEALSINSVEELQIVEQEMRRR